MHGIAGRVMQMHLLSLNSQVEWLRALAATAGPAAFKSIPQHVLSDALAWLTFVVRAGLAVHVASKDVGGLVGGLAALLDSPQVGRRVFLLGLFLFLARHGAGLWVVWSCVLGWGRWGLVRDVGQAQLE